MKKCPFCGADIEDSARFCLYCMQSLTEKEQIPTYHKKKFKYLTLIVSIAVPLLILSGVYFGGQIILGDGTPSDTLPVNVGAHTPAAAVTEKYVDSSCSETGSYDEVVYCSVCDEELSRTRKTVDKKPHDYSQKVAAAEYLKTEATCTDSAVYYCSCICGAKGSDTFAVGEAKGHSYASTWEKTETHHWHKAICEHTAEISEMAEHNYGTDNLCDTCGYDKTIRVTGVTLSFSYLAMTIDDVKELSATVSPSNAADQSVMWTTSNNSVVVVDANGMITAVGLGSAKVRVTTMDGNKIAECTVSVSVSDKTCPHTTVRTEYENEVGVSCETGGTAEEVVYCTSCGSELSRVKKTVPSHGHDFGEWIVDTVATCVKEGTRHHVCAYCKNSVSERYTDPNAHSYDDERDEACNSCGFVRDTRCAHTETEAILGYEATCTSTGLTDGVRCKECEEILVEQITLSLKAHTKVVDSAIEATCTASGLTEGSHCLICGTVLQAQDTIPIKEHTRGTTVSENTVASSCSAYGYYDEVVYCSVCKTEMSRTKQPIAKEPHTLGNWVADKAATCTSEGTRHSKCTVCGEYVYEKYIDLNAHVVTDAWTLDDTYHWHTCSVSECAAVVGKAAHNVVDGFCKDCGVKKVDNATYTREGDYIYFGEYPQSLKTADVTITDNVDVRGYYVGSDGCYYAKALATPRSNYKFKSGETISRGFYYFKVEPLRWRILSEEDGSALILCDSIITNVEYNDMRTSTYEASLIREWLNEQFYEEAFNELQKYLIGLTLVENDLGDDTNDKVFLLKQKDVTNPIYGFDSSETAYDAARLMIVNDYARATGTDMDAASGYGTWMLGEAKFGSYADSMNVLLVGDDGLANYYSIMTGDCWGVVPALRLRLNGGEYNIDSTGLFYKANEGGTTCTVTGVGNCAKTDIVIPSEINGMKVTRIGEGAFWGCDGITSVTIPDGVTSIGKAAFGFCTGLTSITVPASVVDIEERAFEYCEALTSVVIGEDSKLTSIGGYAFNHCPILSSINIPASLKSIGKGGFSYYYTNNLKVYVTDIVAWCDISFENSNANPLYRGWLYLNGELVKDLVIPDGVTSIKDYAFFYGAGLNSVTLPEGVTTIGKYAFYYGYILTSIVIPESVTSIGESAFEGCSKLSNIYYRGSDEQWQAISKGSDWDAKAGEYFVTYEYKDETTKETT